ncbi:LOW QUALITY PROTEIN: accessory gland-specific peptide 26Aa [Drosophila teissieri]|uniref:LOW QUALITY PROTEIN: accessory gland-specific peptide 26Aa n=1 Tax=Drosophila teissieri TaxID=7243 RepID=UPI001CB9E8EA|nr:LOW QUALITY PROTEIN: accessory gland-specific peptide 26Aa [Drosophila teissieri]
MKHILLCSASLLLLFTVANCIDVKPANSSISGLPKSDSTNSKSEPKISPRKNAKGDSVQDNSKKNSIKSDVEEEDDLALSEQNNVKLNKALRTLRHRLRIERTTSFMFRNISVALMREVEVKKQEILNARKSNLNLEVELNDANRKILELNLQLEDVRKSVKPCPKKNPNKEANQLLEAKIHKSYRERYQALVRGLIQRLNEEIPKEILVPYVYRP